MNTYFLSLLQVEIRIMKQKKNNLFFLNYEPENEHHFKVRFPDIRKGDVIVFRNKNGYSFWDGSSIINSNLENDSEGIPRLHSSPFLVSDTQFSPDYWGFNWLSFHLSKKIRKRITSNFNSTTKSSEFRIGKRRWIYLQKTGFDSFPLTKSTLFYYESNNIIVSYNFDHYPLFLYFLRNLWKKAKKWVLCQQG
jgi:hypothetical protein